LGGAERERKMRGRKKRESSVSTNKKRIFSQNKERFREFDI
jgi:hypothetical protein